MTVTILQAASSTDLGRRQVNQDRVLVDHTHQVYVVADGMGGHRGGATAAEMAVAAIAGSDVTDSAALIRAVESANAAIFERSRTDPDLHGMGTTITAMAIVVADGEERLSIANVGDSRAYRLRAGELELLTEDHNIVSELVRDGQLSPQEARTHRQRSVLTRAVGVEPEVAVDVLEVLPTEGDRFLLCSDGLTGDVDKSQIAGILRRYADPAEACRDLIRVALAAGSKDNISAVIVDVMHDSQSLFATDDPSRLTSRPARTARTNQTTNGETSKALDDTMVLSPLAIPPSIPPSIPPAASEDDVDRTSLRGSGKRLITARTLAFLMLLAAIAGVAYWAVSNAPSDNPIVTSVVTTIPLTTTIEPPSSLGTTSIPSTGIKPTLALPSTALGAPTTGPIVPEAGVPNETIPVGTSPVATSPNASRVVTTSPVRTLPTSLVSSTRAVSISGQ